MGGVFSIPRSDGRRNFLGIPICPSGNRNSQKVFKKINVQPERPTIVNESHSKNASSEWTTVPLHVPDSPQIYPAAPTAPPRKNRGKTRTLPRSGAPLAVDETEIVSQKTEELLSDTRKPVEEPLIVPKKEPVHICDGHHHHVHNSIDGKVIHDTHIHGHKHQDEPEKKIETKPQKSEMPIRPKHSSTVSLPDFEELSKTAKKNKIDPTVPYTKKKKPTRHISVVSLPSESKASLSATTVARLENYMMRCKSFGSLPPKQLLEKLENEKGLESSDSDDSWEGLDDWDIGIIEHEGFTKSPVEPKYRLANHTRVIKQHPPPHSHPHPSVEDYRLTETIEEDEESDKRPLTPVSHNNGIITLKRQQERRESIDDFFDSTAVLPIKFNTLEELKKESAMGRRGSGGICMTGYDKKCYPFKQPDDDSMLNSDTFFTNSLLISEKRNSEMEILKKRRQSAGDALHAIAKKKSPLAEAPVPEGEDDLLDTFQQFYNDKAASNETDNRKDPTDSLGEKMEVQHSSLLKFLQENSPDREVKKHAVDVLDEEESQPLKDALKDVEEKLKKLDDIKISDRDS